MIQPKFKLTILFILLTLFIGALVQEINAQGISTITFSSHDFRAEEVLEKMTSSIDMGQDEFMNIHFTLKEPLVKSLQRLNESLSEAELLEQGNFHFSFFVDDVKLFEHNLNTGAGAPESKTTQLSHRIPMIYPERINYWGWYTWLRFYKMGGGQDALANGVHQVQVEIRPYLMKGDEVLLGDILAKGEVKFKAKEIAADSEMMKVQNIKPNSGWELSDDAFDKSKIEAMNKKIAQNRFEHITSVAVIKNGELLLEEYFNGMGRDDIHNTRSVGKTFASTMMGIAIDEGHIKNEDAKLSDYYNLKSFDNYNVKKDAVTLKSLLTMSSDFLGNDDDWDSPGNEENMYPTEDWVKFTLDLPMNDNKKQGEYFEYFTAGAVVLGDVIHQSVPRGLVHYTDEKLFEPLGISNYQWQFTPTNVGNTAGGLQLTTLDYAKYGQLYKNGGQWKGKQILSNEWVDKSLAHQKTIEGRDNEHYGYLFWNKTFVVNGKSYETSYCAGNGGNKIFIFKDIPYVIVITAQAYGLPYGHMQVDQMMKEYILPAVLD